LEGKLPTKIDDDEVYSTYPELNIRDKIKTNSNINRKSNFYPTTPKINVQPINPPRDSIYMLESNPSDNLNISNDIYYIILCSESSITDANESLISYKNKFNSNNIDFKIFSTIINEKQWYRVAVGHYSSYNKAQEILNQLKSYLPPGAWVQRYQQ
jgi:septal ring-binding cell division protein DamX